MHSDWGNGASAGKSADMVGYLVGADGCLGVCEEKDWRFWSEFAESTYKLLDHKWVG